MDVICLHKITLINSLEISTLNLFSLRSGAILGSQDLMQISQQCFQVCKAPFLPLCVDMGQAKTPGRPSTRTSIRLLPAAQQESLRTLSRPLTSMASIQFQ
jgi:hypothetical protein